MKTILTLTVMLLTSGAFAQDYFALIKKNDDVTFNYPESSKFYLIDENNNRRLVNKGEALDVTGNYTIEVESYWSDTPEIIKSEGGRLELFILPKNSDGSYTRRYTQTESHKSENTNRPAIRLQKELTVSNVDPNEYNALLVFSNEVVVSFRDGDVKAYQDGDELDIRGKYLIDTKEGMLKLSYDPKDGQVWYVFEKKHN